MPSTTTVAGRAGVQTPDPGPTCIHTPETLRTAGRVLGELLAELTTAGLPVAVPILHLDLPVPAACVNVPGVHDRDGWLRAYAVAEQIVDGQLDAIGTDNPRAVHVSLSGLRDGVRVLILLAVTHEALDGDAVYDNEPVVTTCTM